MFRKRYLLRCLSGTQQRRECEYELEPLEKPKYFYYSYTITLLTTYIATILLSPHDSHLLFQFYLIYVSYF